MIGQYLPQTNENATVPKPKFFCKLNKASAAAARQQLAATNGAGNEIRDESARAEVRARIGRMATPDFW